MAKGLLIESSTECALLCFTQDEKVIAEQRIAPAHNLSKNLLPSIHELLLQNGASVKDLHYVAIGIGPGAYTGVRVGAIVGKALAYSLNIPLISFESPLAFLSDQSGSFVFAADAKMGQYYLLQGVKNQNQVTLHFPAVLVNQEALDLASFKTDFIASPAADSLNPSLLASIAFERFCRFSPQEFKLLYYR